MTEVRLKRAEVERERAVWHTPDLPMAVPGKAAGRRQVAELRGPARPVGLAWPLALPNRSDPGQADPRQADPGQAPGVLTRGALSHLQGACQRAGFGGTKVRRRVCDVVVPRANTFARDGKASPAPAQLRDLRRAGLRAPSDPRAVLDDDAPRDRARRWRCRHGCVSRQRTTVLLAKGRAFREIVSWLSTARPPQAGAQDLSPD